MKNTPIWYGVIGLLSGIVLTVFVSTTIGQTSLQPKQGDEHTQRMDADSQMMLGEHGESMTMEQMTQSMQGLSGDELDKTFVEMMIDHHMGAIDMAKMVQTQGRHQEIRDLAEDIVTAQTVEIEQMKQWQNDWGYTQ